ncbi:MAG: hypothetical protein K9N47_04440 [Prosthecobacter sp.]|uniref:hypothetical protein n=1 Tax=Prosthecobacter sp. TaxID=1965333 RepID=UPI0025F38B93|nr:hypothetical protein [Prosthecobacter sp.]MCF7785345.1 hypothetical protein [Prosthecobacter sp.]
MKPVQLIVFIIWGALCGSLCLYAVMLNVMSFAPTHGDPKSLGQIIALAAGSAAVLSFFLRKLLLGGFITGALSLDDPAHRGRFIAGNVVVFALSEGVGVLGFVNGILSNGKGDAWLPYIGLAFILMLLHIPLPSRFKPAA